MSSKEIPVKADDCQSYTITQFMARWNLTRAGIYREINSGVLPTFTLGKRRFISLADEQAWKDERNIS